MPITATDALMLQTFTETNYRCAELGLTPITIGVTRFDWGAQEVTVQFTRGDQESVDYLADSYGFEPGPGDVKGNYTRSGRVVLDDQHSRDLRIPTGGIR